MSGHVVVRADGGPGIGYGHLVRTGALVDEFLDDRWEVTYATVTPEPVKESCASACAVKSLDPDQERSSFVAFLESTDHDLVVTDSYEVDMAYQRAIRRASEKHAVVSDDTRVTVCADVVVNGNIYAPELTYEWVGAEPKWCLGTDFTLLRRSIRELARQSAPWQHPPERALITMGGTDASESTVTAMRAFDGRDLDVAVVVGPGFSAANERRIRSAANDSETDFRVHVDPPNLPQMLFESDIAVSALGTTTYELLSLQTPFVGSPQVDNQRPVADALRDRDVALVAPFDATVRDYEHQIDRLCDEPRLRRRLQRNGASLVDGRGTLRTYRALTASSTDN
ncbi:PseG/SpsG family protein [Haloarchaeobius sp. DT45]|uniref:PseG/SpsG family protein n=1 Tax=Haloarchaeobius sp. DT45 TaxID=3446116 RepID=UPI003F6D13D3